MCWLVVAGRLSSVVCRLLCVVCVVCGLLCVYGFGLGVGVGGTGPEPTHNMPKKGKQNYGRTDPGTFYGLH